MPDKHVTGGARTSAPLHRRRAATLPKELSRQLIRWLLRTSFGLRLDAPPVLYRGATGACVHAA
jgi:hypothetical protein